MSSIPTRLKHEFLPNNILNTFYIFLKIKSNLLENTQFYDVLGIFLWLNRYFPYYHSHTNN